MSDSWEKMLLLERIRELSDAEYKFSMRAVALDLLHHPALDYSAADMLRKDAIRAFENDRLVLCKRLCAAAEFKSVRARSALEQLGVQ